MDTNFNLMLCCIPGKYHFLSRFMLGQKVKRERKLLNWWRSGWKFHLLCLFFGCIDWCQGFWCVLAHHFFPFIQRWSDMAWCGAIRMVRMRTRDWKNCQYFFLSFCCMGWWTLNIVWNAYSFGVNVANAYDDGETHDVYVKLSKKRATFWIATEFRDTSTARTVHSHTNIFDDKNGSNGITRHSQQQQKKREKNIKYMEYIG